MKEKEIDARTLSLRKFSDKEIESQDFWICSTKEYCKEEYNAKESKCSECGKKIFYLGMEDEISTEGVKKVCPECAYENHKDEISEEHKDFLKLIILDNKEN